jgi:hypothetical protein
MLKPRERLIVALDVPSVAEAEALVARLGTAVSFYKIGYQLGFAGGLSFAEALAGAGKRIFVDMKLHDIGHTVAHGIESIARMGASFATVHAYPQTMLCSPPMTTRIWRPPAMISRCRSLWPNAPHRRAISGSMAWSRRPRRRGACVG